MTEAVSNDLDKCEGKLDRKTSLGEGSMGGGATEGADMEISMRFGASGMTDVVGDADSASISMLHKLSVIVFHKCWFAFLQFLFSADIDAMFSLAGDACRRIGSGSKGCGTQGPKVVMFIVWVWLET